MPGAKRSDAACAQYELQVQIEAPPERVWRAIVEETNAWWLPDFHMVGENSTVEFDTSPGGRGLVEYTDDGGNLLWYSVHFFLPKEYKVYLVGHIAPDWGGPSTSNLRISVTETDSGDSVVQISDAVHGNIDDGSLQSLESGWNQLFTDGLKSYIENDS